MTQKERALDYKVKTLSEFVVFLQDKPEVLCDYERDGSCIISHDRQCSTYKYISEPFKLNKPNVVVLSRKLDI